jgi:uncharacterized repeat protein (TIGR03803 family)
MLRKISLRKRSATLVLLFFGVLLGVAWAQTESVLYSFCAHHKGILCTDGGGPVGLAFDQKGQLYGTTQYGGAHGDGRDMGGGVVFKLTPGGKETVLYSFCAQYNCADGEFPSAALVFDQKGNLYGTTLFGGAHAAGAGVVFKLTPEGRETVLYSFCAQTNCTDGQSPSGGLVLDLKGILYGTTEFGGAYTGGVVFKVTPEGKETVLYSFCSQTNCTDGDAPVAGAVFDQTGNLYGTTLDGGAYGYGTVFKLTPSGKETVLHSFCPAKVPCPDGMWPAAPLVFDQKGNLYGTTTQGGGANYAEGVVFKLTPSGKETVLHRFCAQKDCADGALPYGGLIFDQKGNLYGTTTGSGAHEGGVVFKLNPEGKEKVVYNFCAQGFPCADGESPYTGLIFDQKGNLYGTTFYGGNRCKWGNGSCGVVFKLTP